MTKLLALVLLFYCQTGFCDFYNGTELMFAFLVQRHGDRTPLEDRIFYSNAPARLRELVQPYGYGQLTNEGISRAYDLGKFIRSRYDALLPPHFNESQVYIRATDFARTQMSALAALAAVFPPGARAWNPHLNWAPTPYTMVPQQYDPYLSSHSCPKFMSAYNNKLDENSTEMLEFMDVFNTLAGMGYDFKQKPLKIFEAFDTFSCQLALGLPLDRRIEEIFPRLEAAMNKAWDILYGDEKYIALQGGVMLNDFLAAADKVIAGEPTQAVRFLSAHDFNVYSLVAVTKVFPRPGWPQYSSLYALELRRVVETGQFVVLPVYLGSPSEKIRYLRVEGCEEPLCDISQFRQLTSKYVLKEPEWKKKCEVKEEL